MAFSNFFLFSSDLIRFSSSCDVNNLNLSLDVNGKRMQTGNTDTMIFNAYFIVAYLSKFMSLQAGDIITFDMPLLEPKGHNKKARSNPYWAGRYLIYDMKHIINRADDVYTVHIRAVKDNPAFAYVSEPNSWTHVAPSSSVHNLYKLDNELLGRITNEQGLSTSQHKAFRK